MIAVTMPGHLGDLLSSVPAARALAARHGCRADFWTSPACGAGADLLVTQDFVNAVVRDHDYRAERGDCGVQPWRMASADDPRHGYEAVYHLGFRETPTVPLVEYCGTLYGLPQQTPRWDLPSWYEGRPLPDAPFVALAARGASSFRETFRRLAASCPRPVVEVGKPGEAVAGDLGALDRTGDGFLEMTWVLSQCKWFVGLISAPYVVASGFGCTKVMAHDGTWDLRHVLRTGAHHYVHGHDHESLLRYIA